MRDCAGTGHFHDLYDLYRTTQFDRKVAAAEGLNLGNGFGPFWNPPFVAWMFAPLSTMLFIDADGVVGVWVLLFIHVAVADETDDRWAVADADAGAAVYCDVDAVL